MSTADQARITSAVAGKDLGTFDTRSGGETTASGEKYRAGGGEEEVSVSRPSVGEVTISRKYKRERDHELARWLRTKAGKADGSVNEQLTDDDDLPWGKPVTWTGRLLSVNTGDVDSNSQSEPRFLTLTFMMTKVG